MASTRRSDWKTARDEYIQDLDDRFPDHPYQQQTREWRDKILLEDAEKRGENLASGLNISFTKPSNDTERKFVIANQSAAKFAESGDELGAVAIWQKMADQLAEAAKPHKNGDPEERQWYLLALRRVVELDNRIKDRREFVETQREAANAESARGVTTRRSRCCASCANSSASSPTSETYSRRQRTQAGRTRIRPCRHLQPEHRRRLKGSLSHRRRRPLNRASPRIIRNRRLPGHRRRSRRPARRQRMTVRKLECVARTGRSQRLLTCENQIGPCQLRRMAPRSMSVRKPRPEISISFNRTDGIEPRFSEGAVESLHLAQHISSCRHFRQYRQLWKSARRRDGLVRLFQRLSATILIIMSWVSMRRSDYSSV